MHAVVTARRHGEGRAPDREVRPARLARTRVARRGVALAAALISVALIGPAGIASSAGATASSGTALSGHAVSGCNPNGERRLEASGALPPRAKRGFVRLYCDDFRGRFTGRAGHGWMSFSGQPGGNPGTMFSPSHISVEGGMLVIRTSRDPSFGDRWASGGVCACDISRTYGAYYVRSRITGRGDDNDELLWPAQHIWPPEIDFNETSPTTSKTGSYVHFDSDNHQIAHQLSINLMRWHTWGVVWTPQSVTFTVDGRVWGRVTDPVAVPRVPMTLDIETQTFCYSGGSCPSGPVSLEVDWVSAFARR